MSSLLVRNAIIGFVKAQAPTEKFIDLTAETGELENLLADQGVAPQQPWIGFDFIAGDETPITFPATNSEGSYRETGSVYFHIVTLAVMGAGATLLSRGEALRNLLRGQRIGTVKIESVTPMSFQAGGGTLKFEGTYVSGSFIAAFQNDLQL